MSTDSLISHIFSGPTFSYDSVWFAGIYVRGGGITKLFLVRVIMGLARIIGGGVRFTFTMTGISVRVVEWH